MNASDEGSIPNYPFRWRTGNLWRVRDPHLTQVSLYRKRVQLRKPNCIWIHQTVSAGSMNLTKRWQMTVKTEHNM